MGPPDRGSDVSRDREEGFRVRLRDSWDPFDTESPDPGVVRVREETPRYERRRKPRSPAVGVTDVSLTTRVPAFYLVTRRRGGSVRSGHEDVSVGV